MAELVLGGHFSDKRGKMMEHRTRSSSFIYLSSAYLHASLTGFLKNLYPTSQMPEILKYVALVYSTSSPSEEP